MLIRGLSLAQSEGYRGSTHKMHNWRWTSDRDHRRPSCTLILLEKASASHVRVAGRYEPVGTGSSLPSSFRDAGPGASSRYRGNKHKESPQLVAQDRPTSRYIDSSGRYDLLECNACFSSQINASLAPNLAVSYLERRFDKAGIVSISSHLILSRVREATGQGDNSTSADRTLVPRGLVS
jgi:hypothetical protein